MKSPCLAPVLCSLLFASLSAVSGEESRLEPCFRCVDLDVGQFREVVLPDGTTATVKLLAVQEKPDPVREAVRGAELSVEVNGVRGVLPCATYNLRMLISGVRIDCPVIKGYLRSYANYWSIDHDARFRIWPQDGPRGCLADSISPG